MIILSIIAYYVSIKYIIVSYSPFACNHYIRVKIMVVTVVRSAIIEHSEGFNSRMMTPKGNFVIVIAASFGVS